MTNRILKMKPSPMLIKCLKWLEQPDVAEMLRQCAKFHLLDSIEPAPMTKEDCERWLDESTIDPITLGPMWTWDQNNATNAKYSRACHRFGLEDPWTELKTSNAYNPLRSEIRLTRQEKVARLAQLDPIEVLKLQLPIEFVEQVALQHHAIKSPKAHYHGVYSYASQSGCLYIGPDTVFGLMNVVLNDFSQDVEFDFDQVDFWTCNLMPGWYKLKLLFEGFDIVRVEKLYLTEQEGIKNSYDCEIYDRYWNLTYRTRGFQHHTIDADYYSTFGWYDRQPSKCTVPTTYKETLQVPKKFYSHASFFILHSPNTETLDTQLATFTANIPNKDWYMHVATDYYNPNGTYLPKPYLLDYGMTGYMCKSHVFNSFHGHGYMRTNAGRLFFSPIWYRYAHQNKQKLCDTCGSCSQCTIGYLCKFCRHCITCKPKFERSIGFTLTGNYSAYSPLTQEVQLGYADDEDDDAFKDKAILKCRHTKKRCFY